MPYSPMSPADLVLRPDPSAWRAALSREPGAGDRALRHELGLPTNRPIVMSGHQPTFWHSGILAKWIALVRFAAAHNAHAAWVVVDHDAIAPTAIRLPIVRPDHTLAALSADLSTAKFLPNAPASARSPAPGHAPAVPTGEQFALPSVAQGLTAMTDSCTKFASVPSAAEQVARAASHLIHNGVLTGSIEPTLIFATHLSRTSTFRGLVARMLDDPARCALAYNAAVAAHPRARLRPLHITGDDAELPLWLIQGGQRLDVHAAALKLLFSTSQETWNALAPKALFMTLLLRLDACDLFIHGLGGGGSEEEQGYDDVMQDWSARWLDAGPISLRLAPVATVSATLRLPFEGDPPVTLEQAHSSQWTAWHAKNEPQAVGDGSLSRAKRTLASAIDALPPRDPRRRTLFMELRSLVARFQQNRSGDLASLTDRARVLRQRADADALRLDRTWPFPLYPPDSLLHLRQILEDRLQLQQGER